jgi:DNA-binding NtrC family response regulator
MRPIQNSRTVLVVDDDEAFRVALRELLEQRGMTVRVAADAFEASREIDAGDIDVIFTDIRMPGGGFEVLTEVRQKGARTPVIFITGSTSSEWRRRAEGEGVFAYLIKPVGKEDILAVLRRAFERGRNPAEILAQNAAGAAPRGTGSGFRPMVNR